MRLVARWRAQAASLQVKGLRASEADDPHGALACLAKADQLRDCANELLDEIGGGT